MLRSIYRWGFGVVLTGAILLGLFAVWTNINLARAEPRPYVDLNQRKSLPAIAPAEVLPLRLAVAAIISPQGTAESYNQLATYLGQKLGRPVELVQRRTYAEVNDLIKRGEVDVAFICTSAYVIGRRNFGMELLAAPQVNGETVYYSWLIVPASSSAQNMADLRGKTFAFTDPWSNTGRMYPTALVASLGQTPETFFGRTFFTYSHDNAIRAVASGVADGAAVHNLVYQYAVTHNPRLAEQTKVIHRSPAFGIPPVVTSPNLRPQVRAELQRLFLEMADDPAGRESLRALDIDRFLLIEDHAYDSVRDLEAQIGPLELK